MAHRTSNVLVLPEGVTGKAIQVLQALPTRPTPLAMPDVWHDLGKQGCGHVTPNPFRLAQFNVNLGLEMQDWVLHEGVALLDEVRFALVPATWLVGTGDVRQQLGVNDVIEFCIDGDETLRIGVFRLGTSHCQDPEGHEP